MKHIHHYTFFVLMSLVMSLLILYVHPSVSSMLFPWKRIEILRSFVASVQKSNHIDPQNFWKFRESYYPGSLTVAKSGIKSKPLINLPPYGNPLYFAAFRSRYIQSDEFLVTSDSLNIILRKQNEKLSYSMMRKDGVITMIFVKPIDEMVMANGFYDYKDKDKKKLKGKYWFVYTTITTEDK